MSKFMLLMVGMMAMCLSAGCEGSGDSGGSGALDGSWRGTTAGRPLTMNLNQDGTSLSGSYKLENPDFEESLSGTASSDTPPATAVLSGGGDRQFRITFQSESAMSGGFFKGSTQVGTVNATK